MRPLFHFLSRYPHSTSSAADRPRLLRGYSLLPLLGFTGLSGISREFNSKLCSTAHEIAKFRASKRIGRQPR